MTLENTIRPIILWGMMGTGKSTVGPHLAAALDYEFFDLDELICQRVGLTIAEIFESQGETYFREVEREMCASLLKSKVRIVLAAGGGALLDPTFRRHVRAHALVISLQASTAELVRRLNDDLSRPLLAGASLKEAIETLVKTRSDHYQDVECVFKTDGIAPEHTAQHIAGIILQGVAA